MGYNTRFTLTIIHDANGYTDENKIISALRLFNIYDMTLGNETDNIKWYDHEKDINALSKQFPNIVFRLEGIGEETHDHWVQYFVDGHVETATAVITFPSINVSDLENRARKKILPVPKKELDQALKVIKAHEAYLASLK